MSLEIARWALGAWLLWRVPRPRPGPGPSAGLPPAKNRPASRVSVVVPARNEETGIKALVDSLTVQTPLPGQLLVVDDGSTDATATLAAAAGAQVVSAGPLPDGWTGKAWACARGAELASGEVLVFLDADTVVAPGGLDRLLGGLAAQGGGGLVSVQPFHVTKRPYERLSAFFNLVGPMGTGAFTPLSGRAVPVGAFGPCLVCDRADYESVGGHAGVRSAVLDDAALARRFSLAGLPVRLLGGRGTVSFRMYAGGLAQLTEGWTKNMASGAGIVRPAILVLVVAWLSGAISAARYAVLAGMGRCRRGPATGLYLAYVAQLAWMLRRVGRFGPLTALAFPVPLAFFLAIFARSVAATALGGQVRWKGRTVPIRRAVS